MDLSSVLGFGTGVKSEIEPSCVSPSIKINLRLFLCVMKEAGLEISLVIGECGLM